VLISGPAQAQKTQQIAQMLTDNTSQILRKNQELISIAIRYVEPENRIVGGQSLAAHQKSSAFVEIKITDETNTRTEKATYIQAVYDGLLGLMPDLHHETFIHVDDVRAGAYGYGGKTQEHRAHNK
jgi:4-oxalocrotonate tautomerase